MKSIPKVEKNGKVYQYSPEEFEEALGVTYLHGLEFQKMSILAWIQKECQKALKKNLITMQQKWLGSYYEDEILTPKDPPIILKWIDQDIGWGVFAEKDLTPKTYIGEYTGFLRKKKNRLDKKNSYCFEYMIGETKETNFTIDAQDKGNFTRFINHSPTGNADPMIIYSGGIMRVIIYANQKIPKGAQITYDYGPDYWAKRESPI
ncbi:MAG TPA: SET domain-containing protein-lysine N-methyltransferase [Chlamydiales bacterium]|nr:SET domain-containing protein-lysine N-methyltransferase [Chlamydiales bacterium]